MIIELKSKENLYNLMRQCGYHYERTDTGTRELIFIRTIGGSDYPRFHIYVKSGEVSGETFVNLHLDQKRPIYKGVSAHAGEYGGKVVESEAERIKKIAEGP